MSYNVNAMSNGRSCKTVTMQRVRVWHIGVQLWDATVTAQLI